MPFYKGLPLLPPVSPYHVLPFLSPISLHNHLPLLSLSLQCLTCWFCSFFEVTSVVWLPTISLCSTLLSPESLYNVLPFLSLHLSTMSYPFFPLSTIISYLFFLLYIFIVLPLSLPFKSLQPHTCGLCCFCKVIGAIWLPTLQAAISLDHGSLSDRPPSRRQLRRHSVGSPGKEQNWTLQLFKPLFQWMGELTCRNYMTPADFHNKNE